MCGTCGCTEHAAASDGVPEHVDARGHRISHTHAPGGHERAPMSPHGGNRITLSLEARILAKNDARAVQNRAWFGHRDIVAFNFMSSPGSGKTTLLCRTIQDLRARRAIYVIEGDQETSRDADRIREAGAPAVQLNTGTGCHLEAEMVARAVDDLGPPPGSLVFIENVGNLVCPAMFDLGERAKVVVLSVTEGDDKPLKYPHMFRAANLMLLNKVDLLPYVDFDTSAAIAQVKRVNPQLKVMCVSARTGEGLPTWYAWIAEQTLLH
jgi:hydrogenase nickel incorporation protein HypB